MEVITPIEGVTKLSRVRVPRHGVDGEVRRARAVVDRDVRIRLSHQSRDRGRAAGKDAGGNGNVDGQTLQFEDRERLADKLDGELFGQQCMELPWWKTRDFEVQIAWLSPEHQVADTTADQPGSSAIAANELLNFPQRPRKCGIFDAKAGWHLDFRFAEKLRGFFR
ncbi:MAG: hypothetical protein HC938_11455 [Nitrospira sp.]|nr:hypothetical protein [Nitrospira sp.]